MSRVLYRWLPAVLIMAAIFFFSSIPSKVMPNFGGWDTIIKKAGHMAGYALLGFSYFRVFNSRNRWAYLAAVLAVVIYAISDEYHQSFVPGRNSTFVDVGIDTIGACLGLISLRYIPALRRIVLLNMPGAFNDAGSK